MRYVSFMTVAVCMAISAAFPTYNQDSDGQLETRAVADVPDHLSEQRLRLVPRSNNERPPSNPRGPFSGQPAGPRGLSRDLTHRLTRDLHRVDGATNIEPMFIREMMKCLKPTDARKTKNTIQVTYNPRDWNRCVEELGYGGIYKHNEDLIDEMEVQMGGSAEIYLDINKDTVPELDQELLGNYPEREPLQFSTTPAVGEGLRQAGLRIETRRKGSAEDFGSTFRSSFNGFLGSLTKGRSRTPGSLPVRTPTRP